MPTTPDDVFPGIFAGSAAGDFAGLPPAPAPVPAVPPLADRLNGLTWDLAGAIPSIDTDETDAIVDSVIDKLRDIAAELRAGAPA